MLLHKTQDVKSETLETLEKEKKEINASHAISNHKE